MTGMAMMQILIRMSIQGSIIVGIVWILRMVFRGLRISYRYCVLLWGIVFFYLIFPWKIENEHGFWWAQSESMVVAVSADGPTVVTGLGTGIVLGQSAVPEQNVTPGQSTLPEQVNGTDATTVQGTNFEAGSNELPVTAAQSNGTAVMPFLSAAFTQVIFAVRYLWLAGIPCFLAYLFLCKNEAPSGGMPSRGGGSPLRGRHPHTDGIRDSAAADLSADGDEAGIL